MLRDPTKANNRWLMASMNWEIFSRVEPTRESDYLAEIASSSTSSRQLYLLAVLVRGSGEVDRDCELATTGS